MSSKRVLLIATISSFFLFTILVSFNFSMFKQAVGKFAFLIASLFNHRSPILVDINNERLVMSLDEAFFAVVMIATPTIAIVLSWITYRVYSQSKMPEDTSTFDARITLWRQDLCKQRSRTGMLTVGLALLILVLAFQIFDRILPKQQPPVINTSFSSAESRPAPRTALPTLGNGIAPPVVVPEPVEENWLVDRLQTQVSELRACVNDADACGPTTQSSAQRELNRLLFSLSETAKAQSLADERYAAASVASAEARKLEVERAIAQDELQNRLAIDAANKRNEREQWDAVLATVARALALFSSMFFFGTSLRMYRQTDSRISELNELSIATKYIEGTDIDIAKMRSDLRLRDFDGKLHPDSIELSFAKAFENAAVKVLEKAKQTGV